MILLCVCVCMWLICNVEVPVQYSIVWCMYIIPLKFETFEYFTLIFLYKYKRRYSFTLER